MLTPEKSTEIRNILDIPRDEWGIKEGCIKDADGDYVDVYYAYELDYDDILISDSAVGFDGTIYATTEDFKNEHKQLIIDSL